MALEIQLYRKKKTLKTDVSQIPVTAEGNLMSCPLVLQVSVSLSSKRTPKFYNTDHGLLQIGHRQFDRISSTTLRSVGKVCSAVVTIIQPKYSFQYL